MEWLRELSTEEVKAQLSRFKGVGPKTISCVLMFTIGSTEEFPVDTHVRTHACMCLFSASVFLEGSSNG